MTLGANYYIHGQAAKFTIELNWYLDDADANDLVSGVDPNFGAGVGTAAGLLASAEEDQVAISAQFQLLF